MKGGDAAEVGGDAPVERADAAVGLADAAVGLADAAEAWIVGAGGLALNEASILAFPIAGGVSVLASQGQP